MAVVNDHTVKAFDEDLNRLRGLISEMGGRAEQALLQAMTALHKGDLDLAAQVVRDLRWRRNPETAPVVSVLVIEDLTTAGGSMFKFIDAIRAAGGVESDCFNFHRCLSW